MMKFACWSAIAIGFVATDLAIWGKVPATQAALGVFMMLIGLLGFTSVRLAKLEETVKELKEKNARGSGVKDIESGS